MTIDQVLSRQAAPSKEQIKSALNLTFAVTEAIREAGEIPSGTLYVLLCGKLDITAYNSMIEMLKRTGLVTESAHLLKWAGPKFSKEGAK